jgi:hypothetical protein
MSFHQVSETRPAGHPVLDIPPERRIEQPFSAGCVVLAGVAIALCGGVKTVIRVRP